MHVVREAILSALADSQAPISGDRLAERFGISRTAVWKHVQALRGTGIDIESLSGRGYRLRSDVLTEQGIGRYLDARGARRIGDPLVVLAETDSTNAELLRRAEAGAAEGLVLFAGRQSRGRGRLGRSWHTFAGDGLAFSLLLRPKLPPERICELPLVAACGMYDALSRFAPGIALKWPNDVLHQRAKLAGILTEMRAEPGSVHAVVIGIGVNVRAPDTGWPEDITQAVTDLSSAAGRRLKRAEVAAACIRGLDDAYELWQREGFAPIRQIWWQAHAASGQMVRVHDGSRYIEGIAEALDDDGALLLNTGSGTRRIIAGDLELMR